MPKLVDKAERRSSILTAAASVFARCGYQGATMDQVAEAAGVAKGALYLAFPSKDELFYALCEELTAAAARAADSALDGEAPALDQLERVLLDAVAIAEEQEALLPLMLEFWASCVSASAMRERFGRRNEEMLRSYRDRLTALLEAAAKRGEIDPAAPREAMAACLIAMLDGLYIQQMTVPNVRAAETLRAALPVFLHGLRDNRDA